MRGRGFGGGLRNVVCRHGDDGVTARFHRPFQPFDGFVDPLIVVLGICDGLLPECIRLMQARGSAIHAVLLIWRVRPDRIFDDPGFFVVNIGQARVSWLQREKAPARTNGLRPCVLTISILGT